MAETLESIAEKITALGTSMNQQFAKVDERFAKVDERFAKVDERFAKMEDRFGSIDQQLADLKAHLSVKIEAVDHKVGLAYEAIVAGRDKVDEIAVTDASMKSRLDNHEVRIMALESRARASE